MSSSLYLADLELSYRSDPSVTHTAGLPPPPPPPLPGSEGSIQLPTYKEQRDQQLQQESAVSGNVMDSLREQQVNNS